MSQSATPASFSITIDRPPLTVIGNHQCLSSAWSRHYFLDLVIFHRSLIGTNLHRQIPYRLVTIFPAADLYFINSRCVSKDTCPKIRSTTALPLLTKHKIIIVKIFLRVFLSLSLPGLEQKDQRSDKCKVCPTNHYATLNYFQPILIFAKVKLGGYASIDTSIVMLVNNFGCLNL